MEGKTEGGWSVPLQWRNLGGYCEYIVSLFTLTDLTTCCYRFRMLLGGAGMKASELHTEILELAHAKLVTSREIDSKYNTFTCCKVGSSRRPIDVGL